MDNLQLEYLEALSRVTQEMNNVSPVLLDSGQLDRGLEDNENHPRYFGYKTGLNTDFEKYLSEQISFGESQLSVLDVGAGRGAFLGDLEKKFGDKISCFGISSLNFENPLFTKAHYIIGDAFNEGDGYILGKIPEESMNLVTSQFVDHPEDSETVLKYLNQVGRILKPKGISRHLGLGWNNDFLYLIKESLENKGLSMDYSPHSRIKNNCFVGGTVISLSKKS